MRAVLKRVYFAFIVCFCVFKSHSETNSSKGLSAFEKAELKRLLDLDIGSLSQIPVQGVLGYQQEYWRNPASVHVIKPEDITLNGYLKIGRAYV